MLSVAWLISGFNCATAAESEEFVDASIDGVKVDIFGGTDPGGPKEERTFGKFLRDDAEVGYYDGEGPHLADRGWRP